MATTIVNPTPNNNSSSSNSVGYLIGGVVFLVIAFLFIVYVLPSIQKGFNMGGTNVNVPKDLNVNVKQTK